MKIPSAGFTLIELLVVVSVIALLSVIVLASLNAAKASGRDTRRLQLAKQYATALELYRSANSGYPGAAGTGVSLGDVGGGGSSINFSCLGETGGTCFLGLNTFNAALNAAIKTYIPGPPADTDPVTLAGQDAHGLVYGYCQTLGGTSCSAAGTYALKWYMESTPTCIGGATMSGTGPYLCTYSPK